jgi:hypothetical protein
MNYIPKPPNPDGINKKNISVKGLAGRGISLVYALCIERK